MRSPALRTPSRTRESLTILKQITAGQTLKGADHQCFSPGGCGSFDMSQMNGYFFFRNAHYPGQIPCGPFRFAQVRKNLLTDGLSEFILALKIGCHISIINWNSFFRRRYLNIRYFGLRSKPIKQSFSDTVFCFDKNGSYFL